MSEWEKLVVDGQQQIADTSSKRGSSGAVSFFFEKQIKSEGAYCT